MSILKVPLFVVNSYEITGFELLSYIIIPFILFSVFVFGVGYLACRLLQSYYLNSQNIHTDSRTYEQQQKKYIRNKRKIYRIGVFLSVFMIFVLCTKFLEKKAIFNISSIFSVFSNPFYVSGDTSISIRTIFFIIVLFFVSYFISNLVRHVSKKIVHNTIGNNRKFDSLIQIIRHLALLLSFLIGLSIIGIDVSSFVVMFGILGVGIGFGLQDIVANFFSGLVIGFTRIITEGDRVFIRGIEGDVQQINIIHTVVRSLTQEELIIPNKFILNDAIQNYSHNDSIGTAKISVQVDYKSDLHHVKKVVLQVVKDLLPQKEDKNIIFRVSAFEDSGILINVYILIDDVRHRYQIQSDLNMSIWERFKEENINIPYPQRDIWIQSPKKEENTALVEHK